MSRESQPLLDSSEEKKESPEYNCFRWNSLFSNENTWEGPSSVGIFELFRFTNRTDRLLLLFGVCAAIADGCSYVAYLVLFGQLTGAFAEQSYTHGCQNASKNVTMSSTCPLGIDLNALNHPKLQKFCFEYTSSLIKEFRMDVMNKIQLIFVVGIISFLSETLEYYLIDLVVQRQTSRIRTRVFRLILQKKISYFDMHPTGHINQNLFETIDKFQSGLGYKLALVISAIVTSVAGIVVALFISWQLTLILLLVLPLIFITTSIFSKITSIETFKELQAYANTNKIVQEVFSCIRTVLSLNGSKYEQERYEKALLSTTKSSASKGAAYGLFVAWVSFQLDLIYIVGFISGSLLLQMQRRIQLNISDVIIIVTTFAQSLYFISSNGPFVQAFLEARAAASAIFRLIDEVEENNTNELDLEEDHPSIQIDGTIRFDGVSFEYPTRQKVHVLQNIDFIARKNEKIALVGASGCGKTSCVSLLLRYYEPSSGRILIDEQSIADFNVQQIRENIAIVSQEPILFDTTIYENIRFGKLNACHREIEQAAEEANAHAFIQRLPNKYETLVGERGVQLSGGEKQRIALARALVKQARILLLDEATSALDPANERIVQEALDRACQGRTTVVITHRLETIRDADRIYILANGKLVEQGTHDTLLSQTDSRYRQMITWPKKDQSDEEPSERINTTENRNLSPREEKHSRSPSMQSIDADSQEKSTPASSPSLFRRLLIMNSPEWGMILIGSVACIISGLAQPLHALLLMKMIDGFDECTYEKQRRQVLLYGMLLIILGLIMFAVRFGQFTAFAISGSKLAQRVSLKAFAALHRQEIAYFDRPENSSGALCSRLSMDASAIQQMIGTRLGIICETLAMFLFGLLFGLFINTSLALITFVCLLLIMVLASIEVRIQNKLKQRSDSILQKAHAFAVDAIQNIRTVKEMNIEKEFSKQYNDLIDKTYVIRGHSLVISALLFGTYWTMSIYTLAILYWRTLILFERNEIQLQETLIVFAFATYFLRSMQVVLTMTGEIGASLSAARSYFGIIDREPLIDNGSTTGKCLENFRGEIKFDHVCFAYPARPASLILNKLTWNIKSGQRIAIVGPSGSGKSTVLQLLERFYDVAHGCLYVDGVDIRQLNIQWFRSCVGYVSQEPVLFDMTIGENISYGLKNVTFDDIVNAAKKANIHSFIEQLPQGYETNVSEKGCHLSGGEKQRIAIARALIRQPKILLLDEVTSALDSANEKIIQEIFSTKQGDDPRRTTIIITHRLSTVQLCDLICVIDKKNLSEVGRHEDLIQQRGMYYRMLFGNLY